MLLCVDLHAWLKCLPVAQNISSYACMKKLMVKANEAVFLTLCHAISQVLHSINTDLIRQLVLLPVFSCLLLQTWWLTDNTLQCDCWNWSLLLHATLYLSYLSSIYRCTACGSSFTVVFILWGRSAGTSLHSYCCCHYKATIQHYGKTNVI